jgi:DNA sulfur modification protein DndC
MVAIQETEGLGVLLASQVTEDVKRLTQEIQALYALDAIPWIVGYSGGKDSTAVLQLVWNAIAALPPEQRQKSVHVISTDTLVENPVISTWVTRSLRRMDECAKEARLPFHAHQLTPTLEDSFWVNLIGKGYPAPRQKFRWCTERLKIHPANRFIRNIVRENGETILVLGTRKAESAKRAATMAKHAQGRVRDRLSPNASLPNSQVYSPIEDWNNDHVWLYLNQWANPWGHSNKELFGIYRGATADNECPLVVDTTTPSCGSSRFGCWVCTLVDRDKSMEAMVLNDETKEWMQALLDFREELDFRSDEKRETERQNRDFRRISGNVHLFERQNKETGKSEITNVPGPYLKKHRDYLLRRLLETQQTIQKKAPPEMQDIELISLSELSEIRRIWVQEKHEFDDSLPRIYQEVTGGSFKDPRLNAEDKAIGLDEWHLLEEICGDDAMHFELVRKLLSTENNFSLKSRRMGILDALEDCFDSSSRNEIEAIQVAKRSRTLSQAVESGDVEAVKNLLFEPKVGKQSTPKEWSKVKFSQRDP